ncbi:glycine receptor subunit alpha-2-like [Galendromus occidentalis]|uniref:Glycine receptor subunit alpha-2-like n=1 Tax=Galendromus occidentalis TaxID=34638 RepID=A0AAJ6QUD1_9ACAR|nr:glycine receptor subunit alpha-2-like [Galendromus occidentalis]
MISNRELITPIIHLICLAISRSAEGVKEPPVEDPEPLSPVERRSSPLNLETNFILEGFGDFRPIEMDFEIDISINMSWSLRKAVCELYEQALMHDGVNTSADGTLVIPPRRLTKNIYWLPDLLLVEAKSAEMSSDMIYTINGKFKRRRDCSQSEMIVLSKQKLVLACQLDLSKFPFDIHTCPLTLRSFSHNNGTIRMKKSTRVPVLRFGNNRLQEFSFRAEVTEIENDLSWFDPTTPYSSLRIEISFKRKMLNVVLTAFLPCSTIVMVSMLAYLMDVNATYERVVLTMTTSLSQYTLLTTVRSFLPPTSYLTRCDVFMYVSLFFNLAMVIECATIDKINTHEKEILLTKPEQIGFEYVSPTPRNAKNRDSSAGEDSDYIDVDTARSDGVGVSSGLRVSLNSLRRITPNAALKLPAPSATRAKRKNRSNRVSPAPRLITPWSNTRSDSAISLRNAVCPDHLFRNIIGPRAERVDKIFKMVLSLAYLGFQACFWAAHLDFLTGVQMISRNNFNQL